MDRHLTLVNETNAPQHATAANGELIIEFCAQADITDATRQAYASHIAEFAAWLAHPSAARAGGSTLLVDASRADVTRFMAYLMRGERFAARDHYKVRSQLAPSTRKRFLAGLHSFYRYLLTVELVGTDPTDGIKRPKVTIKPGLRLTADEVRRLLAVDGSPRDRIQVYLLVFTGARANELRMLRWRDVNMNEGTLMLLGKGNKYREIFIHPRLKPELRRWQLRQDALAERFLEYRRIREKPDTDFVLVTNRFKHLPEAAINKMLKRRAVRAGLYVLEPGHREHRSEVTPHSLRRTFATILLNDGEHIDAVADVLGHESVDTTRKHYAIASRARRKATIDAFNV